MINFDEFKKVEVTVGEIKVAEKVPDTDNLFRLEVDFGEEENRQIISGISAYFEDPAELIGKKTTFVTNLEPRTIRGLESNGMIFAAHTEENDQFSLLLPDQSIPVGTKIG